MQAVQRLGAQGEQKVAAAINLVKNSRPVQEMAGRIPDFVDKANKAFHEVKNVKYQAFTQQLRDMVQGAEELSATITLWLRNPESISGPLRQAAEAGKVIIEKIPQ